MHILENYSNFVIFKTETGKVNVDVFFQDDTLWLTQAQICDVFQRSKSTVSEHLSHIFEEKELLEKEVVRNFRTTASDGKSLTKADLVYQQYKEKDKVENT